MSRSLNCSGAPEIGQLILSLNRSIFPYTGAIMGASLQTNGAKA
jgi:hypothetical protein